MARLSADATPLWRIRVSFKTTGVHESEMGLGSSIVDFSMMFIEVSGRIVAIQDRKRVAEKD